MACGARGRKRCNWKRERESATRLAFPQTDDAVKENEWCTANNAIKSASLEVPDDNTATTDSLSHRNSNHREEHREPHK